VPTVSTKKSGKISAMVAGFQGRGLDARYLGYFDCFNRELFYEAHDVLEDLWLLDRKGQDGDFYKGLIQLAGAFVHLQKGRVGPARALLGLARGNLERYPDSHCRLDVPGVLRLINDWHGRLADLANVPELQGWEYPRLTVPG
jgi:predicted metal-dependent hydrolase